MSSDNNKANNEEDFFSVYDRYCAVDNDGRPASLVQCAMSSATAPLNGLGEDSSTNVMSYRSMTKKRKELEIAEDKLFEQVSQCDEASHNKSRSPRKKKQKRAKALRPYYLDKDGLPVFLKPQQTVWYLLYIDKPDCVLQTKKFKHKFRRRFRMPYPSFLELLDRVKNSTLFDSFQGTDAIGRQSSPIGLLLLGSLRYLGRGLTFDDLEESTAIGEETHRRFFHVFIHFGAEDLFPFYVRMPTTAAEFERHQREFTTAGLHGAGFSTDATNVVLWSCDNNLRQQHLGFKSTHPARSYNLTTNHRREILYTTAGHPARWNDKTLAYYDKFMCGIHENKILQDVTFTLFEWSGLPGKSVVRTQAYRGGWGLVDNGYHRWSCTQAPGKADLLRTEVRLSEFIESFRKDVECVFGILKGRWRVLKTGIRLQGVLAADRIWLTCCALHNMLLHVDGLSEPWDGELGMNDPKDFRHASTPFAISRLDDSQARNFGSRQHEAEAAREVTRPLLEGEDDNLGEDVDAGFGAPRLDDNGAVFINSMSYASFRAKLVEHFDILHSRNKIVWPTRRKGNKK